MRGTKGANMSFLQVDKDLLGKGLKSIDVLILAQVKEFERNKCECFITNEQFAEMFGESVSTIKRSLDKLEKDKLIKRDTKYIDGNGRANRQRVIKSGKSKKNPPKKMVGSKSDDGRFNSEEWSGQDEPIKEKEKEKKKINNSLRSSSAYAEFEKLDFASTYDMFNNDEIRRIMLAEAKYQVDRCMDGDYDSIVKAVYDKMSCWTYGCTNLDAVKLGSEYAVSIEIGEA